MYKHIIRPILFLFDPEWIHHRFFWFLTWWYKIPGIPALAHALHVYKRPSLEREVFGLKFPNPVGLAAGFDKDGLVAENWANLGFGMVELGTVTPKAQAGNPKKRLFRLPKDQGIINRMGFNNRGVEHMVAKLKGRKRNGIIVGGNIGKNKVTPNEEAVLDYEICFEALYPHVDYFVVNVSSPNTPGLRELQEKEPLTQLLSRLQALNHAKPQAKPLLLKIAPDLTDSQLDDIVEIAQTTQLAGLVATNTTISREGLRTPQAEVEAIGAGGLSGAPLTDRAIEVIRYLHKRTEGKLPLISVGGIMTPEDAVERFKAGASLVQVYSGFIYSGPNFAKEICKAIERAGV